MLVVGSSLTVHPAAEIPLLVKERGGGSLLIINMEPTEYDDLADVVIHCPAGKALESVLRKSKEIIESRRRPGGEH